MLEKVNLDKVLFRHRNRSELTIRSLDETKRSLFESNTFYAERRNPSKCCMVKELVFMSLGKLSVFRLICAYNTYRRKAN